MRELTLDKAELERLIDQLDRAPEVLREAKRKAFQLAAPKMKVLLEEKFSAVGLRRGTGEVLGWQECYVGSGGGYSAVRPKAKTFTQPTRSGKTYAVGYVTNSIESGHRFPSPSGKNQRYSPRIRSGMKVRPYAFYDAARGEVVPLAQETVQNIGESLLEYLEGQET